MKNVLLLCGAVAIAAAVAVTAKSDPPTSTPYEPASKANDTPQPPAAPAPASETALVGEVREAIDVAEYTYLRLATQGGELWAAVSKTPVTVGAQVSIVDAARMTNFESATLKRTFDVIYFGNLGLPGRAPGPTGALPPGHPPLAGHDAASSPHGAAAAPLPASSVKVTPAVGANAYAIAALFSQSASLDGKPGRVRGQIVKATPVQGVTYYRLRDGSSEEPSTAELVVSSTAQAKPGDVVTFEGRVRTNVDVGIGFKYPVMLEHAKLVD